MRTVTTGKFGGRKQKEYQEVNTCSWHNQDKNTDVIRNWLLCDLATHDRLRLLARNNVMMKMMMVVVVVVMLMMMLK